MKNSVAGITRSPPFPRATTSAPSASITAGMSEAGSPWAIVPPSVPRVPHLRVADLGGRVRDDRAVLGEQGVGGDRRVPREGADRDVRAAVADVREVGEPSEVDELRRPRDPELQRRDQRLAARQELRVATARGEELDCVLDALGDVVVERCGDHAFASSIARQTRSGVAGIWMSFTPR